MFGSGNVPVEFLWIKTHSYSIVLAFFQYYVDYSGSVLSNLLDNPLLLNGIELCLVGSCRPSNE